jgi:hypothetical protein
MKKTLRLVVLTDFVLYVLQFLVIPQVYDHVFGRGNEGIAVIVITTVLISLVGMLAFADKVVPWLIGLALYAVLTLIYTPLGVYGLGLAGIDLDGLQSYYDSTTRFLGIAVLVIFVLILQLATLGVAKLINHCKTSNIK